VSRGQSADDDAESVSRRELIVTVKPTSLVDGNGLHGVRAEASCAERPPSTRAAAPASANRRDIPDPE
jgi:hypothetical protein